MSMTNEEKSYFHDIQNQEYKLAVADGLQGIELSNKVKDYALGLIVHIIDGNDTPKKTVEMIKLTLRSEKIISCWIDR